MVRWRGKYEEDCVVVEVFRGGVKNRDAEVFEPFLSYV